MTGLLELKPENRLTAIQALSHPYFDGLRDEEMNTYLESKKKKSHNDSITKITANKKTKSKQRVNKFNEVNTINDPPVAKVENPYRSLSKGPAIGKNKILSKEVKQNTRAMPINSSIQNMLSSNAYLPQEDPHKADSSKNKFMPSNFSGFYIPQSTPGEGQDRYNYDIDIGDPRSSMPEETKFSRKPPIKRNAIRELDDEEEDDVAVPIEELKAGSWSPPKYIGSVERTENAREVNNIQVPITRPSRAKKNAPSVPAAQMSSGAENNIVKISGDLNETDSEEENNEQPYKQSNKF